MNPPSACGVPDPEGASVAGGAPTVRRLEVVRVERGDPCAALDELAEEVPVALVYNGISHAVMLATPSELEELALGFSLSEGILTRAAELYDVHVAEHAAGIEVQMEIASSRFMALKERKRSLAGRTGCGLCGIEELGAFARPVRAATSSSCYSLQAISAALAALPERQPLRAATGAVHAAAWVTSGGDIVALREDVGRHNALDKLIGWIARSNTPVESGFVLVSSRASYEMVQKVAAAGIGGLVAVSAPTAFAVRVAEGAGVALAGFARPGRLVVYAGAPRFNVSGHP